MKKDRKKHIDLYLKSIESERREEFKAHVDRLQARKAYFQTLEKLHPELGKISKGISSKKPVTSKSGRIVPLGGPSGNVVSRYPARASILRASNIDTISRPPSAKLQCLHFSAASGSGFNHVPEVTGVDQGKIGWMRSLPMFENLQTGTMMYGHLELAWSGTLPKTGPYEYITSGDSSLIPSPVNLINIKYDYELSGNGIWGTDASLVITFTTLLFLNESDGYNRRILVEEDAKLLIATEGSWFSDTMIGWENGGSFSLEMIGDGMFDGNRNDVLTLKLMLDIATWTEEDKGSVQLNLRDFWVPAVYDNEVICIRYY